MNNKHNSIAEPNLHYIWLGKKSSDKDSIENVIETIIKFYENYQQLNKDNNRDYKYGFYNYFIHTDNPDAIKEVFAEEEAKTNVQIRELNKEIETRKISHNILEAASIKSKKK